MVRPKRRHVNFKLPAEIVAGIEAVQVQEDCDSLSAAAVLVFERGLKSFGISTAATDGGVA